MKVSSINFYNLRGVKYNSGQGAAQEKPTVNTVYNEPPVRSAFYPPFLGKIIKPLKAAKLFEPRLPFADRGDIPCYICGEIMIAKKEFFAQQWPHGLDHLNSRSAVERLMKIRNQLTKAEQKNLTTLERLSKKRPNTLFQNILKSIKNPSEIFVEYAKRGKKLPIHVYNEKVIAFLHPFESRMHPVEKEVFGRIKTLTAKHPQKSIQDLMLMMRPEQLTILHNKQFNILDEIDLLSDNLAPESAVKIKEFLNETRKLIVEDHSEEPFKRKEFIYLLNNIIDTLPDKESALEILTKANTLPSSGSDISAFIVKYSGLCRKTNPKNGKIEYRRRSSSEIGERLVSPSLFTIDHIIAKEALEGPKGKNEIGNYGGACGRCNSKKSNFSLAKRIELNPDIPKNAQKQMDKLISLYNRGKIVGSADYPEKYKETLYNASETLIKLDISRLKAKNQIDVKQLQDKYNVAVNYG